MVRVEAEVTVKRPVEALFTVLSDPTNTPKWTSGMQSVTKTSDGPIGVGTTYTSVSKLLGRQLKGESEITAFEANRRVAVKGTVPFPVTVAYTLETVAGGTRVVQILEAEPSGFFKLAQPLLASMVKRQSQNDLENLRDLMEADAF